MILSHRYKFIFIKTYKTAGTSLEVYLSELCGPDDIVTPIYPHVEPHKPRNHEGLWLPFRELITKQMTVRETARALRQRRKFYNHIPAALARQRIPRKVWDSYYKFSIERNPWDRTLSLYHMLIDRGQIDMPLDQYLREGDPTANYPVYCDAAGKLLVDRVIKYERLNEELGEVFAELGVPYEGSLGVRAKSGHRMDRRGYQEVLSPEQAEIIRQAFQKEIDLHGYTFD